MKQLFIVIVLVLGSVFVVNAQKEQALIYNVATHKIVEPIDIVQDLGNAQVLVFGENHGDSIAHAYEQTIAHLLLQQYGNSLAISMEMFEKDVQPVMDEYLKGWITEKHFLKDARVWKNYDDYKPIVELAKKHQIKVVAANSPGRYTNMVTRNSLTALSQLPARIRKQYLPPFPIDTLTGAYYDRFLEAMGGHVIPNMFLYQSQNLWDATMAHSIFQATKSKKNQLVYHLNGKFHSDYYLGTVFRLIYQYELKVVTISFNEVVDIHNISWKDFEGVADYIVVKNKVKVM